MSSITNINNNSSVVNVGRTTPVSPGQQPASRSIPVVLASDQTAVPVEEQNKVQSEVALSLLGIPRSEVALGIFADVNTYDVNPTEWSKAPQYYLQGHGIKHLPNEAGALVEAPRDEVSVLTSKRFFRYQPGRVSAATFGIKSSISQKDFAQNPVVRKYGIFDNFDGYYWETRNSGQGDNFTVVRRTQSLLNAPTSPYGTAGQLLRGSNVGSTNKVEVEQLDDYRIIGRQATAGLTSPDLLKKDRKALQEARYTIINNAITTAVADHTVTGTQTTAGGNTYEAQGSFYVDLASAINADTGGSTTADVVEQKCYRDVDYWIDMFLSDMEWGGNAHTIYNTHNFEDAILPQPDVFEESIYNALRNELDSLGLTEDEAKVLGLVDLVIDYYDSASADPSIASANTGQKPKLDTVYDVKKNFWGYFAAKAIDYAIPSGGLSSGLTEEDIYYKCQRDVGYLIDGYKNDISGGGNAETVYNMHMFFRSDDAGGEWGMSIYSQTDSNGDLIEIARHTALKAKILSDISAFGYTSGTSVYAKQEDLLDKVIANFSVESTLKLEPGNRGFAGNLVALRDGLIMVHAAVYDANLLKDRESIKVVTDTDLIKLTKGVVTFGQHVRHVSGIQELTENAIYKVSKVFGPKGHMFSITDEAGNAITIDPGQEGYFQTVVPFITPNTYNPEYYAGDGDNVAVVYPNSATLTDISKDADPFEKGMMFPFMYSSNSNLLDDSSAYYVGYINTAKTDVATIRSEIDNVVFTPEYINWVKNNVKPEYWGVYEYRVPRSRFSHDRLDGITDVNAAATYRVFSDKATGETGTAYPGQIVTEDGVGQLANSEYEFDFTKVSMLKIEFSWYGAVGALFLAYVPIGNGEARWVRVHHLRASNQLKIASLGNATLPITYNIYGGGTTEGLGDGEENSTPAGANYSTQSHNIVKYGASYYIDGGDRGTVRLYSHNNDDTVSAYGKQFTVTGYATAASLVTVDAPTGIDPTFFIGAKVSTASPLDQNVKVVWADTSNGKIYLSGPLNNTTTIKLIPDRANTVFGLETKREILSTIDANAVRNRVQVYPTKLSTSNLGDNPVRLRMKKTPLFQDSTTVNGTLSLTDDHEITSENLPLAVSESATFLENDESVYGWFQALVGVNEVTAFGRIYKDTGSYYFELLESYAGTVTLLNGGQFLPEKRFDAQGNLLTGTSKISTEKEGLSSVKIATDVQVPIPGTGINIATLYLQEGTEQVDLLAYFDYNKEYLSFPLTDVADTLYFAVDSDQASNTSDEISLGITWEEQ